MAQALSYGAQTRALHAADGFFARLRKSLADHRLYRDTIDELSQLSDRELSDLGIHRTQIREIALESVYGA
jgi:uncharacterized protein YjiS (DUF1127 family)